MEKQILVLSIISIITISILSQNASASILSASTKNPPQATADLLTLNNTSGTHLWWVDSTGKMFAATNADFHGSSVVYDSSGIVIRNPASTFAYTLTGGAIGANRTLNLPVITGSDTIATLGLAQTITAAKTFSGGITMSSALSIGTANNITSTNYQLGQPSAGISFGNGLLFSSTGGALPIFGIAPGGSNHQAALQIFDNNTSSTNYESVYIGSSINAIPQFEIGESVAGTGHTRPLYFYMGANKIAAMTTAPSFVIGTGSNMTTSSTSGYLYIPVTDGAQTGTPTTNTGSVAEYYDGKSNKFCVYNGSWKCVTLS